MSRSARARVAAGVPAGGQFAAARRRAAEGVALAVAPPQIGNDVEAYTRVADKITAGWEKTVDAFAHASRDERIERHIEVADHHERKALEAAARMPVAAMPTLHETIINGHTAEVYAHAHAAGRSRVAAGAVSGLDSAQFVADEITTRAFDSREFTSRRGVPMRAVIVRRGTVLDVGTGQVALTPLVHLHDARSNEVVASYDPRALVMTRAGTGLEPRLDDSTVSLDAAVVDDLRAWVLRRCSSYTADTHGS